MHQTMTEEMIDQMVSDEQHTIFTPSDCVAAVIEEVLDIDGRVDACSLWNAGGVSYYRVNWWRVRPGTEDNYIGLSAFVAVRHTAAGPILEKVTLE